MAAPVVVIVGAGQGGFQTAASLRQNGFDGRILLIGDEPGLPYQRPPLSKAYLKGAVGPDLLLLRPEAFYRANHIDLVMNEHATQIDRPARRLHLDSGRSLSYDHLVLATGARNRALPVPGADLDGVCHLRTLAEADRLRERLGRAERVVVIGAGFIGLEFAAVATELGADVHVLEATERAMGRAVSIPTSRFFAAALARAGARLSFMARVVRILGRNGRVTGVELAGGETLPADLVLVGIGVVPNAGLAAQAGLAVADGVVADEWLLTSDPAISAIGDCAFYPSRHARGPVRLESVQNAVDQARCVAARLTGRAEAYASVPWFWSDQGDLKLQIVGVTTGHDRTVLRGDPEEGRFSVFCFAGDDLLGIESVNRPADHMAGRRLLAAGRRLTPEQAADAALDLKALVAAAS